MIWSVRDPDMKDSPEDTLRDIVDVIREINAAMRIVCDSINKEGEKSGE